jgi:uncharacterized protein
MRGMRAASVGAALAALAPWTGRTAQAGARRAQEAAERFVMTQGSDTIAEERFTRGAGEISAQLLMRQLQMVQTYTADVTADHRVSRLEMEVRPTSAAPGSAPLQHAVLTWDGDTALVQLGENAAPQKFASEKDALPFINLDWAMLEEAVARARATGAAVPMFAVAGARTLHLGVTPLPGDSLLLDLGGIAVRAQMDDGGHLLGAVIPAQQVSVQRVPDAPLVTHPSKRDYSAPPGAPYDAEAVTIPAGDHTLAGTLTVPRSAGAAVPAVVTITGSGPEDRDESLPNVPGYAIFRQVADTLGRRGIAVLRFDDRGFGQSTGDFAAATSADFADDVRAALAFLRSRPGIDGHRLAVLGHSEGGLIAPMVAATDASLRGIVLLAGPSMTGREILRYQAREGIDQDTTIPPARRDSALNAAMEDIGRQAKTSAWIRFFLDYDPLATARRVRVPVLILQGAKDWQVLPQQAQELAAAFRQGGERDVTVHVLPDRDHLFLHDADGNPSGYAGLPSKQVDGQVLGFIADWLNAHLNR